MTGARRVMITGTSNGIGRELLKVYAAEGLQVIAIDKISNLELHMHHPNVVFKQVDITNEDAVRLLVTELANRNCLPDICIFCAAVHEIDNDPWLDYAALSDVVKVDMMSTFNFLSCLLPLIRKPATFVFCSSGVIVFPNPAYLGYFVSKLAVTRAFDIFADLYADRGFAFKSVILGPIASGMLKKSRKPGGMTGRVRDQITGDPAKAAAKIFVFADGAGRRLYYRKLSYLILWLARLVQAVLPAKNKFYRTTNRG